jgi:hypothetical protein
MKEITKKILLISYILGLTLVPAFAFAEDAVKALPEEASATATSKVEVVATSTSKEEVGTTTAATTTAATVKKEAKKIPLAQRKTCEIYVDLDDKVLGLEKVSTSAQEKLSNLSVTLENEIDKRDSFVASLRSLFSLKKSDVDILSEAKDEVGQAQVFYKVLDEKLAVKHGYVKDNNCEKVVRKELISHYTETEVLEKNEDKFRKDLTKKLKEKMQVIVAQVSVEKEKTNQK